MTTLSTNAFRVLAFLSLTAALHAIGANAQLCSAPTFEVAYASYIHVDHVDGPTACKYKPDVLAPIPMIYRGDAFRDTYRATELTWITPDTRRSFGFYKNTGTTVNYARTGCLTTVPPGNCPPSPVNGLTLSDQLPPNGDNDGVEKDCYLWNESSPPNPTIAMGYYELFYPDLPLHQGSVEFVGSVRNPLEDLSVLGPIQWDMVTTIDTSNPQSPTATIVANHTCFPAHQIKINGEVVYSYYPTQTDSLYITRCLAGTLAHIQRTETRSVTPKYF
jgi:hypothetical protein